MVIKMVGEKSVIIKVVWNEKWLWKIKNYFYSLFKGEYINNERNGIWKEYTNDGVLINPLASPSAGAPALKYRYVNTETSSPGEAKGLKKFFMAFIISFKNKNYQKNTKINPLASLGEEASVFTSPYLSAGAPALGEAKGLMAYMILIVLL